MEYQASSVVLSQKLSSGHSIYDGVFSSAAASKFNVSTFSSRVDDYSEIFGGSVASRGGSSIPVLEVPELHERKASVDVRSSKLDYSNVFGGCGFGDSDFAVPYEELFAEPKKKERRKPAEKRSPSKEADPSDTEGNRVLSHEASYQSFDGAKKFNMSYHKTNHRSKSFTGGAMLHAVPAYTCLVDEVSPIHATEGDKPVPSKENGASPNNNLCERMTEGNHLKAARDLPAVVDRKQTSGAGAKVQNNYDRKRSISHSELFNACEINPLSSPSISSPLSEGKVEFEKPMASIFGLSRSDNLEGSGLVSSPPYFDEEVDTNSTAAASAAALIKAIEEAQARINMAKESKERKKTGSQNRVKPSFNNGTKFEVKGDKFVDTVSIPKERKTGGLHEEGAVPVHVYTSTKLEVRGDKFADKVSIPQERKARELHEEVAIFVHDSTGTKLEAKEDKFADKVSMPKERRTRELHEEVTVPVHHSTSTKLEVKGDKYADKVSIPKERKTRGLHEEVAVPVRVSTSKKLEVKGDEFADGVGLPEERKIQELREEVAVPVHFSIFSNELEQVTAALDDANKIFGAKETRGKIENESISTHMGCTQQQADVSEAAEQFYEVADTGEPDFSEAAEQFYEFPDTGELDLSEPAEVFYEFSDSSEHQATTVEDEEANPAIKMIQIADEEEQKRKKTTTEAFENPELCGERLQAAKYDEHGELEKIFSLDAGSSKCEEHASELETVKDAFDQEENENRLEASRELEETWKLQASHVKEILEEKQGELEKQKGDNKRHETQELQETRHMKMKLMPQECVEYQKIGDEAYKQEELEKEQKDVHREEDTERRLNKDSRQDITEDSLNDTNGEQYFENRNESKSEGHEKLGDTTANEMILEGAACEEIECEKRQKESFQRVDDGRMEILIDQGTEDEKVTVAQEDLKKPDCNFEATNNLYEEGENEDLYEKEGPTGHAEYDNDVEETLEGDKYEEIECDKREKESFQCVEDGRMEIRIDQSTEDERVTVDCEDQKKPDCNFEATNNLCEEGENEDLYEKEGPTGHAEYNKDVEETLEGDKYEEIACEKRQKESFQCVEDGITEIQIDQSTEDEKVTGDCEDLKKPDCNVKATNNLCEEGEIEDPNEKEGPTGHAEYDKDVEETLEVPAHEEDGDRIEVTETLDELKESVNQSESVEEDNVTVEKDMLKTDGLAPDIKLVEIPIIDATEMHSSDTNGTTLRRNDMRCGQKQEDQLAREPEVVCNFGKQVEELGAMNKDMMEGEVAVKQEENRNNSRSSHRKRWFDRLNFSETLNKLKENWNQSESVEEENGKEEKEICEADGLASGVKLAEILKQIEDPIESHPCEENGINVDINAMNCGQKQDVTLETHVEEVEEINEDVKEIEVAVNQEENKNNSKSSHRKRWFDDGTSAEVAQLSHMLRRKGGNVLLDHEMETTCTEESMENDRATTSKESVTTHSSLQELEQEKGENRQTTLTAEESEKHCTSNTVVEQEKMENQQETSTAEESEISARLQKEVEIEKELLKQKQHAKGKERERVKEKKAVERVIREARERAFAEARERAAETRQKAMAEAQERSGKTSVKANDISLAEKASREAKLKSERAAVERATEEAWERALEKSLSGKAYEAGKQAKRSVSEKSSSASRDDGMKPGVSPSDPESKSRYPNSSNHSDPYPAERSGGSNGESAQRCKAKLERNQQTAERASKALAEKNMRDLLVQKEQAERNRLAEGLDAEVKRWSSGKERNLRALLSTLQYILGPDSGWQPIPLTEIVTTAAVKKAYRKAALFVHPDKLQQRGASIQQKYTCEKVFDLLKEAWNRFNVEER
ncbi:auxilin-like protein 1 [Pyrus ussuriensis x Pyrus communis]|uniref:Auxilin-like protein 1 n=1 Tax=Pyrus ussuriensis x Pyrus communis TaxID=2448454 RepID=A0A5N5HJG6_9ROSA|nr:auxilin-like protein 1 [Pyrus ussuriensis x Pyrus communis]